MPPHRVWGTRAPTSVYHLVRAELRAGQAERLSGAGEWLLGWGATLDGPIFHPYYGRGPDRLSRVFACSEEAAPRSFHGEETNLWGPWSCGACVGEARNKLDRALPMADAGNADLVQWLAEVRGGVELCVEDRTAMARLIDEGEINVNLIVKDGTTVTDQQSRYWEGVIEELGDRRPQAKPLSKIKGRELLVWFAEPTTLLTSVTQSDTGGSSASTPIRRATSVEELSGPSSGPRGGAPSATGGSTSTGASTQGANPPVNVTEECVKDMKLQGATLPAQLYALSVGYQLAQKAPSVTEAATGCLRSCRSSASA